MSELKKVVGIVCGLANVGGEVLVDMKIDWKDLGQLMSVSGILAQISGVDLGAIKQELFDLSPEKMEELIEGLKADLDIPQDVAEEKIEKALQIVVIMYTAVDRCVHLAKEIAGSDLTVAADAPSV